MSAFATDPRITLQGMQPPEQLGDMISRFAQLKAMGQQSQLASQRIQGNQLELGEAAAAKKDQEVLQQVWTEKGGDEDATLAEAPRRGVRMQTVRALQAQRVKAKQDLLKMKDEEFKTLQEKTKFISSAIAPLMQIPEGPEGDAALVQAATQTLQSLVQQGAIDPQKAQEYGQLLQGPPAQIRQALQTLALAGVSADKQFEAVNAEKKAAAERTAGQKEFADFYAAYRESKGLPKNAEVEMEARTAYRQSLQPPRQPVPGTDIPLPADVEEQRKRMNAARAQVNGLSPQQLTKVNSLASQFDSNPVVQRFNQQVNHAASVKAIVEGEWTGPGDMGVIYEFMKALDPTSVVRESEYAAASKTGNIFLGWMAKFNGTIRPEGGFMSAQVKKDFGNVLDKKLAVSNQQVKQMHGDYARRINKITGGTDGAEYLSDYSTLYGQQGGGTGQGAFQVPAGAPPAPKEDGHTLKANGQVVAISKGGQWVAP